MFRQTKNQKQIPDLDAPIVPGKSAAGFNLGEAISGLLKRIQPVGRRQESQYTVYEFVAVKVWSLADLITQIGVYDGYRGRLNRAIGIGATIAEIESCFGAKVVEDEEDNLIADGVLGCSFEASSMQRDARINSIYVFPP
jgi:hypothetical protein